MNGNCHKLAGNWFWLIKSVEADGGIRLNCFVRWYVFDFTVRHTPGGRIVKLVIRRIRSIRGPFKGSLRSKSKKNLFQNYTNPPQRGQSPAEMPFLRSINFGRCPIVVRSLSSCCPVIDWTTTGQRLDNERRRSCNLLVMNACFSGEKRGVDRHQVYVWVYSATHPAETDICLASRCDTTDAMDICLGLRCDTPRPSATPLREGMGCRITLIIND